MNVALKLSRRMFRFTGSRAAVERRGEGRGAEES